MQENNEKLYVAPCSNLQNCAPTFSQPNTSCEHKKMFAQVKKKKIAKPPSSPRKVAFNVVWEEWGNRFTSATLFIHELRESDSIT